MENVITHEDVGALGSETKGFGERIQDVGRSLRYHLVTRPNRWAVSHPRATLGIAAGAGLAIGLGIGLLWRR